jgi:uncharacterized protein YbjQ (UPF0145 family)
MGSMIHRGGTPIPHELASTTFEIPGCNIVQSLGIVRGIVVRSRSIVGNFGAGLQRIFGGNITIYTTMCEQARENAFDIMMAHAAAVGGNAVIGVRYDATEIMMGVTEVLCYGTAVIAETRET